MNEMNEEQDNPQVKHWADQIADNVILKFGDKERYVFATGISPSGTVHFGNFRETITTDIVVKAMESRGKTVHFIFSWDDFDRLRKVPQNVSEEWQEFIGKPYTSVPDPFGCHNSYAEHFEKEYESVLPKVGINPYFISQSKKYQDKDYADQIKFALNNKDQIREILDEYRREPLKKDWYPLVVYCENCGTDNNKVIGYDGEYTVEYKCRCKHEAKINFKEDGRVKLPWRVDWPMRWNYEKVEFEPAGKEHSTPGGSRTTSNLITKDVWNREPPIHRMYDFIILKGIGGKMSGSLGNVIKLGDVLEVYEPEIVRYLFVGTKPNKEFFVSFDLDVLKLYEDYDKLERVYYKAEEAKNDKEYNKLARIYELSQIGLIKKTMQFQPSFRHLCNVLQIYENNLDDVKQYYKDDLKTDDDIDKLAVRSGCAWNWLQKHAPKELRFKINKDVKKELDEKQKAVLKDVKELIEKDDMAEEGLHNEFYAVIKKHDMEIKDFFSLMYQVLISKDKGPKLAGFILTIGKDRVKQLIGKAL